MLLDHGHPLAAHYAVGRAYNEAAIVNERINATHATTALLLQQAVGSILSKQMAGGFFSTVKRLIGWGN